MTPNTPNARENAENISRALEELRRFLAEISAVAGYGERGMVTLNVQPILFEINNRLTTIQSMNDAIKNELEPSETNNNTNNG